MIKTKGNVQTGTTRISVDEPNFEVLSVELIGTSPLVCNAFSAKTKQQMIEKHMRGDEAKSGNKRDKKDFDALYKDALHKSPEGWYGMPASAFRNALISACKVTGVVMTRAKLCLFILEDGYDAEDPLTGLVRITHGEPERIDSFVRNATGVADIRPRPMWKPGWRMVLRVRYDADQMSATTVANLLMNAGIRVGIGEGRPDSKSSNGMGWGCWKLASQENKKK